MTAIVYDAEIIRCIPQRGLPRDATLEYAASWSDFGNMGVSVVCVGNLKTREVSHFLHELPGARQVLQNLFDRAQHIIGFNSSRFDDALLRAHGYRVETTYDLYSEVRRASGNRYGKGYRLDDLARANLGVHKNGRGALAPVLWQRGQRQRVIDYCRNDVALTQKLFDRAMSGGLKDPTDGATLQLRDPFATTGQGPLF